MPAGTMKHVPIAPMITFDGKRVRERQSDRETERQTERER